MRKMEEVSQLQSRLMTHKSILYWVALCRNRPDDAQWTLCELPSPLQQPPDTKFGRSRCLVFKFNIIQIPKRLRIKSLIALYFSLVKSIFSKGFMNEMKPKCLKCITITKRDVAMGSCSQQPPCYVAHLFALKQQQQQRSHGALECATCSSSSVSEQSLTELALLFGAR